jgi:hypothetical protein
MKMAISLGRSEKNLFLFQITTFDVGGFANQGIKKYSPKGFTRRMDRLTYHITFPCHIKDELFRVHSIFPKIFILCKRKHHFLWKIVLNLYLKKLLIIPTEYFFSTQNLELRI